MTNAVFKALPMLVSMITCQLVFIKVDSKHNLTSKVTSKLPIKAEWKGFVIFCSVILIVLLIGIIGIYMIDISDVLYGVITGGLVGVSIAISVELSQIQPKQNQ